MARGRVHGFGQPLVLVPQGFNEGESDLVSCERPGNFLILLRVPRTFRQVPLLLFQRAELLVICKPQLASCRSHTPSVRPGSRAVSKVVV